MSHSSPDKPVIVFDIRRYLTGGWYLPGAFIVKHDTDGKLTYIIQNATPDTIGSYGYELTPILKQLFIIIESLTEKALEEKFNPPKGKPKPIEVLIQTEEVKRVMERFVHRQMDTFLKKVKENNYPLTFMGEKKAVMEDLRVRFAEEEITPHLIFRRNKDGVLYRLNFTSGGERWLVRWKQPIPLTNQPGWLLVDRTIYPLPDLNGYMVKPFMTKDEQPVPNRILRTYFQKFIMKTVERAEIEAEGFDVTSTRKLEGCELYLTKHLFKDSWFVSVKFHYMGATFQQNDKKEMRTALHFHDESDIRIMQVKRNPAGETEYLDKLRSLNFKMTDGSLWQLPGRVGEGGETEKPFFAAIEWLSSNRDELEAAGFTLETPVFDDKKISLVPASWSQEVRQENDWFDLRIVIRAGQFEFPFSKLVSYIRDGERLFPLPDGTFFLIPEEWMTRFHGLAHLGKLDGERLRLAKSQRPLLESLGLDEGAEPAEKEEVNFKISPLLKATLRPYQETGARWLAQHYHDNLGACLADDMGLGKTLQTLAILLFAKENRIENPSPTSANNYQPSLFDEPSIPHSSSLIPLQALILLPASLVFNWEREIKKFAPGITVCRHVGPQRTKDARILGRYDIVMTTYQTAQRDLDLLGEIEWEYVVLDESQYIKNPQSGIFKAVGELEARHKISLSGTPIENSLSDLWAQMQFLNPGMLGSFNYFKKHFIKPIEKQEDEVKKDELRRLVEPYLLRRTKEQAAPDLPPLTESVFYVEMTEAQAKLYEKEKSAVRNKLLNIGDPSQPQNRVAVLAALTRLRQIANHPALVSQESLPGESPIIPSGKFDDVLEYWETIRRSGHKVLIFSSFEKYLQLFREKFEKAGQPYAWLTGDVAQTQRRKAVDQFTNDPAVQAFFMTTKAGGVGLNLTAADYVFVLDPWWNPFVESQAIARAHRIGQTEKVVAVKFIARDTIEEKILKMQERKSALAGEFLASPEKVACTREGLAELLD